MPCKTDIATYDDINPQYELPLLVALLLLGVALRVISWVHEPYLNPDGIAYILQAKALYLQQFESYLAVYPFPTNLSLMIAGVYKFTGDWIVSGQFISFFFSLLTIIPLYFLNRIFWGLKTSAIIVTFYVASPLFIELSHEIIRGPQFWFFLCLGLWAFCRFLLQECPSGRLLFIASCAFILAAWSRIEGLLPLFLGIIWIFADTRCRRPRFLATYLLPFFIILIYSAFSVSHIDLMQALFEGFNERLLAAINRFQWLRAALLNLEAKPPLGVVPGFFNEARDLIWLLALGVTNHCLIKTFGIIFFPLTIFGLCKNPNLQPLFNPKKRALLFLIVLLLTGLSIIYLQILMNWSSSERFVALIYFPGLIFAGFGLERLLELWSRRKPKTQPTAYLWLCLIVVLLTLPSLFKSSNRIHTQFFKEFGQYLAASPATKPDLHLCGTSRRVIFTHFFAQLDKPIVASPWQQCDIIDASELSPDFYNKADYDFLIFSDHDGGRQRWLELMKDKTEPEFSVLLEKSNKKYGNIALFGRRQKKFLQEKLKTGKKE